MGSHYKFQFSRTVTLAYKQLTKLRHVHVMFCYRHFYCVVIKPHCINRSATFKTTQTDQSKHDILIGYVLNLFLQFIHRPFDMSLQHSNKLISLKQWLPDTHSELDYRNLVFLCLDTEILKDSEIIKKILVALFF